MKFTLRKKIILITVAILTVTVGVGIYVSAHIFSNVYSDSLRSNVTAVGGSLVSQLDRLLSLGIPLNELVGFEEQCQEIVKKYEGISYAMVVDREGRILFHADPVLHGKMLTPASRVKAIQDNEEDHLTYSEQGKKYRESLVPVFGEHDRHIGDIIIGFPAGMVTSQVKRMVGYSVGVSLISCGIAMFLMVLALSSWIRNPLIQLLAAIHDVRAKGTDVAAKVEIPSQDEIGEIAAEFNLMIQDLRHTTVSKEYADAVIQGMMDVLMVTDADSGMVTVNRAVCEALNYSEEDLIGKSVGTVFAPEGNPFKKEFLEDPNAGRERISLETVLRTKQGEPVPVLMSASVLRDKEGQPSRIVYVGKDITAWKKAEAALRESEDRYRDIVEYSQALLCTHDLDGKLLSVNQLAADVFKYDKATLLTMKVQDLLVPETLPLFDAYIAQIQNRGLARGFMRVTTGEGEKRLLEYNNTLRTDGVREPIVRAMVWDVTEQKKLEQEREKLVQDLQKALSEVKTLSGLLPICSTCKKIRDDTGYWRQIESYMHDHTGADFSHSICPDCMKKLYPEYCDEEE
ncbi:MAG: PAS domain S-box protein [Deltaproteobacteria bacterium]|nr:PAS domain S-box protein [Deltaproteobacteria bacterium]